MLTRKKELVILWIPVDHQVKMKERKKDRQILGSYKRAEKAVEHKGNCGTN